MTLLARRTAAKFMKWHFGKLATPMLKDLIQRSQDVRKAQQNVLSGIMRYAEAAAYGEAHQFSTIQSPSEFATRVPINTDESLRPRVSRHERGESNVLFPKKPKTGISAGFHMGFADVQHSVYRCFQEFPMGYQTFASQTETLAKEIDNALQRINPEYHAKRQSNRLGCMLLHPLSQGAFDKYKTRKLKQGNREAQFKMTHQQQDDTQMNLLFNICSETTSLSDGEFQ
jgi:hypothetical protein